MLLFLSLTACIFNCDDGFFPLSKNQKLKTYYLRDSNNIYFKGTCQS